MAVDTIGVVRMKYGSGTNTLKLVLSLVLMVFFLAGCEQGATGDSGQVNTDWRGAQTDLGSGPAVSSNNESTGGTAPAGSNSAKIHQATVRAVDNMSSRNGPDGGNLACAWAVNKILQASIGKKFDHDSTTDMDRELRMGVSSGTVESIPVSEARPGDIVISPTIWSPERVTGHVGIVGENGKIYSNSSREAQWKQNFTMASWKDYYGSKKGLKVNIYRVN
jgi:hypothetical protein